MTATGVTPFGSGDRSGRVPVVGNPVISILSVGGAPIRNPGLRDCGPAFGSFLFALVSFDRHGFLRRPAPGPVFSGPTQPLRAVSIDAVKKSLAEEGPLSLTLPSACSVPGRRNGRRLKRAPLCKDYGLTAPSRRVYPAKENGSLPELQQELRRLFIGKRDRLFLFVLCKSCMEISTVPSTIQKRIVQLPNVELVG